MRDSDHIISVSYDLVKDAYLSLTGVITTLQSLENLGLIALTPMDKNAPIVARNEDIKDLLDAALSVSDRLISVIVNDDIARFMADHKEAADE